MRALEYPRISSNASGNHSLPPNKEEQDWDWQLFATACKRLAARLAWFPRLTAEAAPVLNCASLPTPPPVVDPCSAIHTSVQILTNKRSNQCADLRWKSSAELFRLQRVLALTWLGATTQRRSLRRPSGACPHQRLSAFEAAKARTTEKF